MPLHVSTGIHGLSEGSTSPRCAPTRDPWKHGPGRVQGPSGAGSDRQERPGVTDDGGDPVADLPLVTVISPSGRRTTLTINERTPFYEPYSGTSYLYLARLSQSARTGTYQVIVSGRTATKVPVVIGVGYREVPGVVRD